MRYLIILIFAVYTISVNAQAVSLNDLLNIHSSTLLEFEDTVGKLEMKLIESTNDEGLLQITYAKNNHDDGTFKALSKDFFESQCLSTTYGTYSIKEYMSFKSQLRRQKIPYITTEENNGVVRHIYKSSEIEVKLRTVIVNGRPVYFVAIVDPLIEQHLGKKLQE